MPAFLAFVPRWVWELIGGAALVLAIWLSGVFHERAVVRTRVVKQEVQVEKRIVETDHSHDQELAALRAYRSAHPPVTVRLCVPDRVPSPAAPRRAGTAASGVQPVPSRDHSGGARQAGPDIFPLLEALAARADQVSAGLRRRQELEP